MTTDSKILHDELPFHMEKGDHSLILTNKPKKHLNRKKKKEFDKNKVEVNVELFDKYYIQKLNKIGEQIEDDIRFSSIIRSIRLKFIEFLFR